MPDSIYLLIALSAILTYLIWPAMKTYCRNCNERITKRDGVWQTVALLSQYTYLGDPKRCVGYDEHEPR